MAQVIPPQQAAGSWARRLIPNLLTAALSVVLITAVIGIISDSKIRQGTQETADLAGASQPVELPVTYAVLDARTLQQGEIIYDSDRNILPGLSNKHSPFINHAIDEVISLHDIDLLHSKQVDGFGTLMHYRLLGEKDSDASTSYFGFAIDGISEPDTIFHVGYGHMYELAQHRMTRIFDRTVLKVEQSVCRTDGEACAWYFAVDQNVPVLYAMFEAQSYEHDLDGDGAAEAVIATKKLNQIYIFQEENGQLQWASVRDILHANPEDELVYNEMDGTFQMTASDSGEKSIYAYSPHGDQLVLIHH